MRFENQEEQWRAEQEGWTIRSGWPSRYYDSKGQCPHPDLITLIKFLATQGQTSEFHRRIYLSTPWNAADHDIAKSRGFAIGLDGTLVLRYGATREGVEAALKQSAETGDPFAIKALQNIAMRRLGVK